MHIQFLRKGISLYLKSQSLANDSAHLICYGELPFFSEHLWQLFPCEAHQYGCHDILKSYRSLKKILDNL